MLSTSSYPATYLRGATRILTSAPLRLSYLKLALALTLAAAAGLAALLLLLLLLLPSGKTRPLLGSRGVISWS
jgi:hypothetical protein